MKKRLSLLFFLIFISVFLIFPSVTYSESDGGCSDNPYANCTPLHKLHFGELLGGAKYIKESFSRGSISLNEMQVQNAPVTNGGYYESDNQYFKPLFALLGASITSLIVTLIIYFGRVKQKPIQKK